MRRLPGPSSAQEPDFLSGLPMDNAVGAILALSAEVYLLRERLQSLEAELTSRKVLPAGAVENHQPPADEAQRRQDELAAFTQRVMSELVAGSQASVRNPPGCCTVPEDLCAIED